MTMILRRPLQLGLALLVSSLTMYPQLRQAKAQEAGWITLFDGKDLGQWDQVGTSRAFSGEVDTGSPQENATRQ